MTVANLWGTVLVASALAAAVKVAGHHVPQRWVEHPPALRVSAALPVALLAALVAVQTFTGDGGRLQVDARAAGLAAAAVALLLRAPFLVVVAVAAVVAAGLRAIA